jgi:hypothetical protein
MISRTCCSLTILDTPALLIAVVHQCLQHPTDRHFYFTSSNVSVNISF